ncbi:hypothetical protein DL98DRAFT_39963 [Cadophora sp. DSE1049]|nr:hypothetical protein DL98DRAFT_39963 [Cadophora sp. DSE1049]
MPNSSSYPQKSNAKRSRQILPQTLVYPSLFPFLRPHTSFPMPPLYVLYLQVHPLPFSSHAPPPIPLIPSLLIPSP